MKAGMVIVTGGVLTEESIRRVGEKFKTIRPESFHQALVLEASPGASVRFERFLVRKPRRGVHRRRNVEMRRGSKPWW